VSLPRSVSLAVVGVALACCVTARPAATQSTPTSFAWAQLPSLPRPLSGHATGVSRGVLFVAGGTDFPTSMFEGGTKVWLDEIYGLESGAQAWRRLGRLPHPLAYAATAVIGDRLIVAGGSDGVRHRTDVTALEWIDGAVRQTPLPPLPAPLAMAGAAAIGRALFVVGGQAGPDRDPAGAPALRTVWTLDLSSSSPVWRDVGPLPGAGRILPVVVAQAGRLHVFSGAALARRADAAITREYLRDAWAWSAESGWRRLADPPHAIVAAPASASGQSHIVVFGGDTGADAGRVADLRERHPGFSREILAYHTIGDTWTRAGDLPTGLVTTSAVAFDGRIAIVGGEDRPGHRSSAVLATASRAPSPESAPPHTDLFVAGEAGAHTYRIPSLIVTTKGSLLAFAEARRGGAADAGDIDLVLRRSRDGGRSWSPMQIVADVGPDTVGNPCPVVDVRTGRIWLLTTRNLGVDRERDILAGTSQQSRTVWVMHSDDDGVTWSIPLDITPSVKETGWTWYATGPGVGIQTTSGRLVIPANHAEAGTGIHRSHLLFSDDGGERWRIGASSEAGTNESQVAELGDGRLLLNMRNHPPRIENFRQVATSADGGQTLSRAVADPALIEPPAQASLISLPAGASRGPRTLVFANPASAKRERLTVRVSDDDGRSWAASRVVDEGPSAYSSLASLGDGAVGLLYERGDRSPYERITFTRLTLAWLRESAAR
jgi:sialidase-1